MPSKKKERGKARRAKAGSAPSGGGQPPRQAHAPANDIGGTPTPKGRPLAQSQPTLNQMMPNLSMTNDSDTLERLRVRNRPLLEYLRKRVVATEKSEGGGCLHGRLAPPDSYCTGIVPHVKEFLGEAFESALRHAHAPIITAPQKLRDIEPIVENLVQRNWLLPALHSDEDKRGWFLSLVASLGVDCILEGYGKGYDTAVVIDMAFALTICSQRITFKKNQILEAEASEMVNDLLDHTEHETHRFFSKSVPCKCLRKSYKFLKEAKPITARCCDPQCHQVKKRSELQQCSQCGVAYYCGRSCQSSHWPEHKSFCNGIAKENVEIDFYRSA